MKVKTNHETLRKLIEISYEKRKSIFIEGLAGIGKSFLVKEVSKELAKRYNKEFIDITEKDISKIDEKDYSKYWFFVDVRLSIYDPSDLKGVPVLHSNKEFVEWKMPKEFWILTNSNVYGTLFLDELNQASPSVQKTAFQIVLDRKINSRKISDNVLVVGAGNKLTEDFVERMPRQLINRFLFVELKPPSTEEWVQWAVNNSIDERVIGYVLWKGKVYDYVETDEVENYMTPRSLEMLSTYVKNVNDLELIEAIAVGTLGSSNGLEFINFIKSGYLVDNIYKDFSLVEKYSNDKKYDVLFAFIVNLYSKMRSDYNKYKDYMFKFLKSNVPKDIRYALLRLVVSDNQLKENAISDIVKNMQNDVELKELIRKIAKYTALEIKI